MRAEEKYRYDILVLMNFKTPTSRNFAFSELLVGDKKHQVAVGDKQ